MDVNYIVSHKEGVSSTEDTAMFLYVTLSFQTMLLPLRGETEVVVWHSQHGAP